MVQQQIWNTVKNLPEEWRKLTLKVQRDRKNENRIQTICLMVLAGMLWPSLKIGTGSCSEAQGACTHFQPAAGFAAAAPFVHRRSSRVGDYPRPQALSVAFGTSFRFRLHGGVFHPPIRTEAGF